MDSIIFDLDGTLWDSTAIVANAWTEYLNHTEHMNIVVTEEKLKSLFGRPMPQIAEKVFPDCSRKEQLRLLDNCCQAEHRALLKHCAPLYDDMDSTLRSLSQKYPLYIVSNCQAGYIEVFLESTGFGEYFAGHLCNGDTGADKPENLTLLMRDQGLKSPVYVGDTMGDFLSCQKAKVPFVFASYGFGEVPDPDYRIDKPSDLVRLFI
ncbi:MAG TPA: HAD family hydrolase [Candidatus Blautia excrementipullorum]|nr:HAD family hydrolase [Candidatus Blautia excrementipullorum]